MLETRLVCNINANVTVKDGSRDKTANLCIFNLYLLSVLSSKVIPDFLCRYNIWLYALEY